MRVRLLALCTAAFLAAMPTAPASAETVTTRDARGDVVVWESSTQEGSVRSTRIDIYRIVVRYENGSLVVRTRFRDLTRANTTFGQDVRIDYDYRLDTNPDRRGFEYLMRADVENLHRVRRKGAPPIVSCPGLSWRANIETDIATMVLPRSCFREGERRVVRTKLMVEQLGPGRTRQPDGHYYVDRMEDGVVTGYVRHTRSG